MTAWSHHLEQVSIIKNSDRALQHVRAAMLFSTRLDWALLTFSPLATAVQAAASCSCSFDTRHGLQLLPVVDYVASCVNLSSHDARLARCCVCDMAGAG